MRTKERVLTILLVLTVLLTVGGVIAHLMPVQTLSAEEMTMEIPKTSAPPMPMLVDNPYVIADIAELASPATVFIAVEWPVPEKPQVEQNRPHDPFNFFFDYWFSDPFFSPRQVQPSSAGSGFIIDESGTILTNQHVVGNLGEGQTITIAVDANGLEREYKAEIIGSDSRLDLAVLQIINEDNHKFPTVALGDSDSSRIGEWTIAIGNPYGKDFEHTVTVGVLSAKGREITIRDKDSGAANVYKNLMQTDAAINRGNSGGPLLNIKGEVIGINTAVHSQAQGIGFAIPINVVKEVLDDLINKGGVQKAWVGIYYGELTDSIANQLRLPDNKGVIVSDVVKDSPAAEAGLQAWDVIRRINDKDIFTLNDVADEIEKHEPGDEILVTVYRAGEMHLLPVTLGNMPGHLR